LAPYRPECWTTDAWNAAYASGVLDYYGSLQELSRYSVLTGYVSWCCRCLDKPPRVLDIGCGTGLLRDRLDDNSFGHYVGIDLSPSAISMAQSKGQVRSQFLVGDGSALSLEEKFDVVVLNEVLYYAPDSRQFLRQALEALLPEGFLLVSMWRHPGDHNLWRLVDAAIPLIDRTEVRNRANPVTRRGWAIACYGTSAEGREAKTPTSREADEGG
jgi:2-polyprenyl-6-hydroxyphenyl methylase/3-demethylubiquinone-9 3-methyltransferase